MVTKILVVMRDAQIMAPPGRPRGVEYLAFSLPN
jgi:hypothetical protein